MIAPWLILVAALGGAALALRGRGMIRHPDGSVEEWDDRSVGHDLAKWGGIAGVTIAGMSIAFFGSPAGLAILGGIRTAGTSTTPPVGPPNAPMGVATVVIDTSTVYAFGSAFAGSGADTQDSIRYAITRLAADTTAILTEVKTGAVQIRDTIADNTNLKADTTYKSWLKYHGVSGGWSAWSAPDTFVNSISSVVFWCDWRNAADSTATQAALTTCVTTGDWNGIYLNNSNMIVVDTSASDLSGKGWPAASALRVTNPTGSTGGAAQLQVKGDSAGLWPNLDTMLVGESQYHRLYYLVDIPSAAPTQGNIHTFEARDNFAAALYIEAVNGQSAYQLFLRTNGTGAGGTIFDLVGNNQNVLPKDTAMRVEFQLARTYTDSVRPSARVYVWNGSSYALRYSDADFVLRFSIGHGTGGVSTLADSINYPQAQPWSDLTRWRYPHNGFDGTYGSAYPFFFTGAVCIRRDAWCGAYPISGVEN